jgi:hypothetical protein
MTFDILTVTKIVVVTKNIHVTVTHLPPTRKNIIMSPFVVVLMIKRRVLPTVASHNDTPFAGAVWQWRAAL